MSDSISPKSPLNRRTAVRAGAVAAAAGVAGVAAAGSAQAAPGQAVIQGGNNNAGAAGTTLQNAGTPITLTVKNNGAGAAAYFYASKNNGFAGGTGSGNKYGLSAGNAGAAGAGAGMAASGGQNTGVLANTANNTRFALKADNLAGTPASGGAIWANGKANAGLYASTDYFDVPAVVTSGDVVMLDGGHPSVITINGESVYYGVMSYNGAELTYSGTATLDGAGNANVTIPADAVVDMDPADAVVTVSANSGPMPNLWISCSPAGVVAIKGGVASGKVSYRVVAPRTDLPAPAGGPAAQRADSPVMKSAKNTAKKNGVKRSAKR